jgi:C1A family cysteine protease
MQQLPKFKLNWVSEIQTQKPKQSACQPLPNLEKLPKLSNLTNLEKLPNLKKLPNLSNLTNDTPLDNIQFFDNAPFSNNDPAPNTLGKINVVDLSAYCTSVKSQGDVGACTAFAVCAAFEYILKILNRSELKVNVSVDENGETKEINDYFSERFLYYVTRRHILQTPNMMEDNGASISAVIQAAIDYGIARETLFPWNEDISEIPKLNVYEDAAVHQAVATYRLDHSNNNTLLQEMLNCLNQAYPLVCGFKCFSDIHNSETIKTGVIKNPSMVGTGMASNSSYYNSQDSKNLIDTKTCSDLPELVDSRDCSEIKNNQTALTSINSQQGGHAILIVGYNLQTKMFKFKNSWSSNWGDKGYGYISFSYVLFNNLSDVHVIYATEGGSNSDIVDMRAAS